MPDIQISPHPQLDEVFTPEATDFIVDLVTTFRGRRNQLLQDRQERQKRISAGERPGFLKETAEIRSSDWTIAPEPEQLMDLSLIHI